MRLGMIEPMSRQAFDALLHGEERTTYDPQLATLLDWIKTDEPFRATVLPGQDPDVATQAIAQAARRDGLHVATIAGDGFVAVCKMDGWPAPGRPSQPSNPVE